MVAGPCFVDLDENGGNEAQEGLVVGEDPDLDGPALGFLLDGAPDGVGGTQAPTVMLRQGEDGEPLGHGILQPRRQGGCGVATGGAGSSSATGVLASVATFQMLRSSAPMRPRMSALGAWWTAPTARWNRQRCQVAAPSTARRVAGGAQAGVIVGDDGLDTSHAARDQAVEEATPVDLGLSVCSRKG